MGRIKKEKVKRIIRKYDRVLVGLAHFDKGKVVKGCDCCFCRMKREKGKVN